MPLGAVQDGGESIMSALKLLLSLMIYVPAAIAFNLDVNFAVLGGCILFAGFIAYQE